MIREEIETSRFQTFCDEKEKSTIPISVFFFCPKNAKSNLRHKRSFDAQIQNKDCVFDNTITKVQWSGSALIIHFIVANIKYNKKINLWS